jgi:acetyl-CoA carboxylase/biotin carboxylase 1
MRDMYDEILKFGSYIVDALRKYSRPVFVYIPPGGELRGGAWVVLDPTINPEMMEMYADLDSRGGVLEPSGTVEIKFRDRDLLKAMHRLDPLLLRLDDMNKASNSTTTATTSKTSEVSNSVRTKIKEREEKLLNVYSQAATSFADLHDTPGRMKAKGVINGVLKWEDARSFFYYRLRRRLAEEDLRSQILRTDESFTHSQTSELIEEWCFELFKTSELFNKFEVKHYKELPDQVALNLFDSGKMTLKKKIEKLEKDSAMRKLAATLQRPDALEVIQQLLKSDHIDDSVKDFIKAAVLRN